MGGLSQTEGQGSTNTSITPYRLVGELASGGMGTVSVCMRRAGTFERLYAIKRLHPHLRADNSMLRMFVDEARIAGLVRHANVVSVLDVGEDDDGPFLVMEYVEGTSLSRFIRHHSRASEVPPVAVCTHVLAQVARGLHAAHELVDSDGRALHLVHRDVSPQNILLGQDGVVRVTDFGVAKALGRSSHTSTGLLKGKVGYMSPEQLRFEPLSRRSDLFALGVVLVELLTSRRLYPGRDAALAARRILHDPPPDLGDIRPEVPPALVELSFHLLAKDPAARPETAAEVADRLDEIVADEGPVDLAAYLDQRIGHELEEERTRIRDLAAGLGPPAPVEADTPASDSALTLKVAPSPAPQPSSRRWVGVATIGIAGALGVAFFARNDASAPAVVAHDTSEAAPSPSPSEVIVRVDSQPSGATLRLDGHAEGTTPIELRLPLSANERVLELSRDGYTTTTHRWVPSTNERLVIALPPAPSEIQAPMPEAAVPTPSSDGETDTSTATERSPDGQKKRRAPKRRTRPPAKPKKEPRFRRFD